MPLVFCTAAANPVVAKIDRCPFRRGAATPRRRGIWYVVMGGGERKETRNENGGGGGGGGESNAKIVYRTTRQNRILKGPGL